VAYIHTFGPVNIDNTWRIQNNIEFDKLIEGADMVRFIKAQRIKWLDHIQRMDQTRPARRLLNWASRKTKTVMARGFHRRFKTENKKNWKETAKDRKTWRDLAQKAKTLIGL
jgi:hypothetical protein